jgi:hypothetical protein
MAFGIHDNPLACESDIARWLQLQTIKQMIITWHVNTTTKSLLRCAAKLPIQIPDTLAASTPLLFVPVAAPNYIAVRKPTTRVARDAKLIIFGGRPIPTVPPEVPAEFELVSMVKKVAPMAGPSPSCVRHVESCIHAVS